MTSGRDDECPLPLLMQRAYCSYTSSVGADNVVTWNDIHHKTQNFPGGEYGFPDENYLDNVMEDLAKHGITE